MKNSSLMLLSALSIGLISCTSNQMYKTPKNLDKYWTLSSTPNTIDQVGVIFGSNDKGEIVRIPGGKLDLVTKSGRTELSVRKQDKHLSINALVDFLALKSADSASTLSLSVEDSLKMLSNFSISKPILTVSDQDLTLAFESKKKTIENNLKFLNLDKLRLYLILETIKSNQVDISLERRNEASLKLIAKISKTINLHPKVKINTSDDHKLQYTLTDTLTMFYHLVPIDINILKDRGPDQREVRISIGSPLSNQQELAREYKKYPE